MKFRDFDVLFFVCLIAFVLQCCEGDLCKEAKNCRCSRNYKTSDLYTYCRGRHLDEELLLLPVANFTKLTFKDSTFANITSLSAMRRFYDLQSVYFRKSDIPFFDWNWLPERTVQVSMSMLEPRIPSFNQSCNISKSLNISKVYFYYMHYNSIPSCLPQTATLLSFIGLPLLDFENPMLPPIEWPSKLRTLRLKFSDFTSISDRVLQNLPPTLHTVVIEACNKPLREFPTNWPKNNSILIVNFQNCPLNYNKTIDFSFFKNVKSIYLSNNELTSVPQKLSSSVRSLRIPRNSIQVTQPTDWMNLINMKILDISYNKLRYVPSNLPENLEILNLRSNDIAYIDPTLFSHLKSLIEVDLAHNKLVSMPSELPSTIKHLDLDFNRIVSVQSPNHYTYCYNCTIVVKNNPLICDQSMVDLLVWSTRHPNAEVSTNKKCATVSKGLSTIDIEKVSSYFSYLKRKEFRKCYYTINGLKCINASLSRVPVGAPNVLANVTITHNPNLTSVPDNLYINQTELTKLELQSNSLKEFPQGLPSSLKELNLNDNQIQTISNAIQLTLNKLINLEKLSIEDNQLTIVYDYQLQPLVKLKRLELQYNRLHCDCSIYSLSRWYEDFQKRSEMMHYETPRCHSPPEVYDRKITEHGRFRYGKDKCIPDLREWRNESGTLNCSKNIQLKKELDSKTPHASSISSIHFDPFKQPVIQHNTYWKVLDLSYLKLREDVISLKQLTKLQVLNLTGNQLSEIPLQKLPSSLEVLLLAENQISSIPSKLVEVLDNLKFLDLKENAIVSITKTALSFLPFIESFHLQGNPFSCDCNLAPFISYIQAHKDKADVVKNNEFESLVCATPRNLQNQKLINLPENEYCAVESWKKITGGVVGGVSFLLTIALIAVVLLYKRRKIQERKDVLDGFRQLLEKEAFAESAISDDQFDESSALDYQYDAFVSYCSFPNDEDFVYKMMEILEDTRGRKLCIHERDFVPGCGIADNIVKCISLSRRVIIIISRKYIESAWCQYEVQVALAQIHQHRRGKLLIPVLLEDVTKSSDYAGSIKTILSLISGIHVPSNHQSRATWDMFWDNLDNAICEKHRKNCTTLTYEVD